MADRCVFIDCLPSKTLRLEQKKSDTRNLIETSMFFLFALVELGLGLVWLFHRQTNKLDNFLILIYLIFEFVFGDCTDKQTNKMII